MTGLRFVAQASQKADVVNFDLLNEIMHDQLEADIFGGTTAAMVTKHFEGKTPKEVNVRINSNGGSAYEGITIHNLLRELAAKGATINVKILGIAASAASVVAMAGNKITMAASSRYMIHKAGLAGRLNYANADDLRQKAEQLDSLDQDIARIYARRSGGKLTEEKALELMAKTTYLSDRESVENGLATETDPELQAVALGEEIGAFSGSGVAASNHNKENEEMNITKDDVIAKAPEVAESLRAEGRDKAALDVTNALASERERIKAVNALSADWPGHQELIATLAYDGKTTPEQAAAAILKAEAATRQQAATLLQNPGKPTETVPGPAAGSPLASAVGGTTVVAVGDLETIAKKEWDADPKLANEFDSFESYLALRKYEGKNSSTGKGA